MIPVLAPIFHGPLEPYADTLVLPGAKPGAFPLPELLAPARLDAALDLVAAHFGGEDRRALASLFSIHYVHILMPVVVVANLVLGHHLPVALADLAIVLDEEGLPDHFVLPHDGHADGEVDPFVRFKPLVFDHLEPVFAALAARSGLSTKVMWTNAANLFEVILRELEGAGQVPSAVAAGDRLVAAPRWSDGARNPFHAPVRYEAGPGGEGRWRRVCCVRYLLPERGYCSNCPHVLAGDKTSKGKATRGATVP
ncbi:siderophore-iron reductase FhuF [Xanthobacter versatilis]|uniref:siderophore-iron reductase FhuF n=1 Tax=Xanthobacter autotrophicus (strain ATCC BAA-1158 / Py2) TaxID=78245 RepID=UPI00372855D8